MHYFLVYTDTAVLCTHEIHQIARSLFQGAPGKQMSNLVDQVSTRIFLVISAKSTFV
jgi:hypothetical protein